MYPSFYRGPEPITHQIKTLSEILDLNPLSALCYANRLPPLPEHAEGWFAIPSLSALEARLPAVDADELHCKSVRLILNTIRRAPTLYLYNDPATITPYLLRRSLRTHNALSLLAHEQPGDILIVAAQLGLRHRGRCAREVCEALLPNEYGLDSVAIGSIILTHPHRLNDWKDLAMLCAGDTPLHNNGPDGSAEMVCFQHKAGFLELAFWYSPLEEAGIRGAVTGFFPNDNPSI